LLSFPTHDFFSRFHACNCFIVPSYKDRIPVIVERAHERVPLISVELLLVRRSETSQWCFSSQKAKFLAPVDMTMGTFSAEIKKHMKAGDPNNAPQAQIFLFVNNTLVNNSLLMSQVYEKHKHTDGFLYVRYATENTFG
jgi:hypothetical protein